MNEKLAAIERRFHELLLDIAREWECAVPPELPVLIESERGNKPLGHVPISGMFGGCTYWLISNETQYYLRVVASSRMDHNFKLVWHVDENGFTKKPA